MPVLLSHYRPDMPIYAFTEDKAVQRRLALYHGVTALHLTFLSDADSTIEKCPPPSNHKKTTTRLPTPPFRTLNSCAVSLCASRASHWS